MMIQEDEVPDVETTNWNAVKLLATKYGIQLRSLEEIQEEIQASRCAHASDQLEGRQPAEGGSGGDRGGGVAEELGEDLGVGTPFMITARAVEGGRVIYRFKWRGGEGGGGRSGGVKRVEAEESSEAGYDPGSDSPSSSYGKSAGRRRQASSRTLKTNRSIPALRGISGIGNEKKRPFVAEAKEARQTAPKVQRGDVLGAILGLREGITAQDYSWTEARGVVEGRERGKGAKGKSRERQRPSSRIPHPPRRQDRTEPVWRSISPFGEPVLQRKRMQGNEWQKSPIPRMIDFGKPLFPDVDSAFTPPPLASRSAPDAIEFKDGDDKDTFIFDVLQRYRHGGIEPLDILSPPSPSLLSSPIRARQASSSSDTASASPQAMTAEFQTASAVPGDDARFAMWAIRSPDDNDALVLSSRDGVVDHTSPSSLSPFAAPTPGSPRTPGSGKRWSVRGSVSTSSSGDNAASSVNEPSSGQESKHSLLFPSHGAFLLAASTTSLVAELTSRIDNRLTTDFFYTYRSYLSSCDLLRLLILRFKWAMATPIGPKDEATRKIVRVRTYVIIKYWLSNFFEIDFLPNRALRKQLTDWLNGVGQDQSLPDQGIIKSLKKVVRGLKKGYEQGGVGGILLSESSDGARGTTGEGVEGADELRQEGDPAVSLDWGDEDSDGEHLTPSSGQAKTPRTRTKSEGVTDGGQGVGQGESWRMASTGPGGVGSPHPPSHQPPPPLPVSSNAISRVFVNTVGKLSRFKRNLNNRTTLGPFPGNAADGVGFDGLEFEATDSGDLLFIRGGVENFIKFFHLNGSQDDKSQRSEEEPTSDSTMAAEGTPSLSAASNVSSSTPASSLDLSASMRSNHKAGGEYGLGISHEESDLELSQLRNIELSESGNHLTKANLAKSASVDHLHHFQSDQTLRSMSTAQQTHASPSPRRKAAWQGTTRVSAPKGPDNIVQNIVQIDDVDLSSDEDDGMVRRALRRLPGARDLRMANHVHDLGLPVRTSLDSVSVASFGRVVSASHRSLSSYYRVGNGSSSGMDDLHRPLSSRPDTPRRIGTVQTEMLDPDEALRGYELVKGFRLDQLDSDDEEPGDVEAALRRLEGFIDEDKQKEKQRRVEAMWLRSQTQRQEEEEAATTRASESRTNHRSSAPSELNDGSVDGQQGHAGAEKIKPSAPTASPVKQAKKRPVTQGGLLSASSAGSASAARPARGQVTTPAVSPGLPSPLWAPPAPVHRSFLLNHRSEVIAQQFCLIESELFKAVTWQELVSDQWKQKRYPGQVLDWESFYQSSVRRRAEAQREEGTGKVAESNVEALVARFNLTCNWVASEVVLTRHVDDRAAVICKLIRIAWKCYHHSNFATLTQIILGLQSPWLDRLAKTWSRVGMLEMRMLRDLKAFINPARNFKHLRTSMRDMIVEGGMEEFITSSGPPRNGNKAGRSQPGLHGGCIPFFGLFLSDLAVNDCLPTLIEPSSPNSALDCDPTTGHLRSLADPSAFAHLAALPEEVPLSPLVNLYKYRISALTVKSVLAFQDRINSYQFQADANVYVKALRIRCLEGEQLTQISHLVEP